MIVLPSFQTSAVCYRFFADLWPRFRWNVAPIRMPSCVALIQPECNLPAFIRAILRIVFHAILGRGGGAPRGKKKSARYYTIFYTGIILYVCPRWLFTRENFLPRNKFRLLFRATRGSKIIVVCWRTVARKKFSGWNSRGNKAVGIVRNVKGLFFAARLSRKLV